VARNPATPRIVPFLPTDVQPPTFIPAILTVDSVPAAAGATNATVTWDLDTDDNVVPKNVTLTCSPKSSGDKFDIGTTSVTCTAEDAAGNTKNITFDVTVTGGFVYGYPQYCPGPMNTHIVVLRRCARLCPWARTWP
jgi:hypothetical protein